VVAFSSWRGVVANWRHDLRGGLVASEGLSCNRVARNRGVGVVLYSMGHRKGSLGAAIALVLGEKEAGAVRS
jgi:hypothetical protein